MNKVKKFIKRLFKIIDGLIKRLFAIAVCVGAFGFVVYIIVALFKLI